MIRIERVFLISYDKMIIIYILLFTICENKGYAYSNRSGQTELEEIRNVDFVEVLKKHIYEKFNIAISKYLTLSLWTDSDIHGN